MAAGLVNNTRHAAAAFSAETCVDMLQLTIVARARAQQSCHSQVVIMIVEQLSLI